MKSKMYWIYDDACLGQFLCMALNHFTISFPLPVSHKLATTQQIIQSSIVKYIDQCMYAITSSPLFLGPMLVQKAKFSNPAFLDTFFKINAFAYNATQSSRNRLIWNVFFCSAGTMVVVLLQSSLKGIHSHSPHHSHFCSGAHNP